MLNDDTNNAKPRHQWGDPSFELQVNLHALGKIGHENDAKALLRFEVRYIGPRGWMSGVRFALLNRNGAAATRWNEHPNYWHRAVNTTRWSDCGYCGRKHGHAIDCVQLGGM